MVDISHMKIAGHKTNLYAPINRTNRKDFLTLARIYQKTLICEQHVISRDCCLNSKPDRKYNGINDSFYKADDGLNNLL